MNISAEDFSFSYSNGIVSGYQGCDPEETPVFRLPIEILGYIFSFLELSELPHVAGVCKLFADLIYTLPIESIDVPAHCEPTPQFFLGLQGHHPHRLRILRRKTPGADPAATDLLHGLQHLPSLQELILHSVQLQDEHLVHLLSCHLTHLDMSRSTQISGAGLKDLASLQSLVLDGCRQMSDFDVQQLSGLTQLQHLSLAGCLRIHDLAVEAIAQQFSALTSLSLSRCPIGNQALSHLTHLSGSLETLTLSHCDRLTDDALANVSQCTRITSLNLHGCYQLTHESIASVARLTRLHTLNMGLFATDAALAHAAELPQLTTLRLPESSVTDEGIVALGRAAPPVTLLDLNQCMGITSAGLASLAPLTALKRLSVRSTYMDDANLMALAVLTRLRVLDLRMCGGIRPVETAGIRPIAKLKAALPNTWIIARRGGWEDEPYKGHEVYTPNAGHGQ